MTRLKHHSDYWYHTDTRDNVCMVFYEELLTKVRSLALLLAETTNWHPKVMRALAIDQGYTGHPCISMNYVPVRVSTQP